MTTYQAVVSFINIADSEVVHIINGFGSGEPLPAPQDIIHIPGRHGADKIYIVKSRTFVYGGNGDRGAVREVILYVAQP